MDTNEAASWVAAENRAKSSEETKRKLKGIKWTTRSYKVPVCPKCGTPMDHELDIAARASWKWTCRKCIYTI